MHIFPLIYGAVLADCFSFRGIGLSVLYIRFLCSLLSSLEDSRKFGRSLKLILLFSGSIGYSEGRGGTQFYWSWSVERSNKWTWITNMQHKKKYNGSILGRALNVKFFCSLSRTLDYRACLRQKLRETTAVFKPLPRRNSCWELGVISFS